VNWKLKELVATVYYIGSLSTAPGVIVPSVGRFRKSFGKYEA